MIVADHWNCVFYEMSGLKNANKAKHWEMIYTGLNLAVTRD